MICAYCHHNVPHTLERCPYCGHHLHHAVYCEHCGTRQEDGERFCPKCGTPFITTSHHHHHHHHRSSLKSEAPIKPKVYSRWWPVIVSVVIIGLMTAVAVYKWSHNQKYRHALDRQYTEWQKDNHDLNH